MAEGEIAIDGLSELNDLLETLPANIQGKVMRGALRAGQVVVMAKAKEIVPIAPANDENAKLYNAQMGSLRDSLKIGTRINRATGEVVAYLRAGNKTAYYARWVEFGTKAHIIKAANGKVISFGGREVPYVNHPGARANPFMRIAIDSQAKAAVDAVVAYLGPRINKEIAKLPDEVDS